VGKLAGPVHDTVRSGREMLYITFDTIC